MALFGSLSTLRAQLGHAEHFAATFAYLDECFRPGSEAHRQIHNLGIGQQERTELAGGAFGLEQVYKSKPRSEGFFESHRKYIDVQVIVEGTECMEVADIAKLKLQEDRTPAKDLLVFAKPERVAVSPLRLDAGDAAVLFSVDGHMPGIAVADSVLVRKIVVKVPVF